MATISLEPNESFEHYHATLSRTIHLEGEIEFCSAGSRRRMHPGEIIEVPANTKHTLTNIGASTARIGCLHVTPD